MDIEGQCAPFLYCNRGPGCNALKRRRPLLGVPSQMAKELPLVGGNCYLFAVRWTYGWTSNEGAVL